MAARWRTRGCTGTTRLAAPRRAGVSIFLFVYVLPLFVDKVFTPFVARARKSVPRYQILLLIIGTHIFFPPVFITTTPIIWLAAWMFSFWEAIGLLFGCEWSCMRLAAWHGPRRLGRMQHRMLAMCTCACGRRGLVRFGVSAAVRVL